MKPKHYRAIHYLNQGLFDKLSTFGELEDRIRGLNTPQERGDVFEVFAEAYFSTQRIAQATEVWTWSSVPEQIKRQLKIKPSQDMGVDGVYQTEDGHLVTYQVKFRSRRNMLHWGGADGLSTFFGLTERADQRVIFTNTNALPNEVLEGRANLHSIRGHELDHLQESDFKTIREWLGTGVVKREKWEPRPHQKAAIESVCSSLAQMDRATMVMACGTGKTLVALWAAEKLKAKNILVLVPSLALVSQTLTEWVSQNSWDKFSFLCVCSDASVKDDALKVHTEELPFDVTTSGDDVRRFLRSTSGGTKLVFSTYQSAQVVAEGMSDSESFDLGIFDEAHKTAGRKGKTFGFALEDRNLRINKRLFMTATPRHYNVNQRDKEGDAKLVFSMDVPEVYGEIVHTLSFAEAARLGIICDYKIIISVVTSDMLNEEMRRRGEVLVDGEEVKAQWVANQVALQKALEESGANRVLTFHTTIKEAKLFTSDSGEGIGYHLPDYRTYHISGNMPTSKRETIMGEFSEGGRSLISNARCLTEGVDVPAIDMVAFMSPKKSKVDIVQATGRAMRQSKTTGKTVGYVFLPLFLEVSKGESIDESLERTQFDHIAYVLNAIKEDDKVLADEIQMLGVEKGRTGGLIGEVERLTVLSSPIDLSEISAGIHAAIVQSVGDRWDEMFGVLLRFKDKHGHSNASNSNGASLQLHNWVGTQRAYKIKKYLKPSRIMKLDKIGFDWRPSASKWESQYEAVKAHKAKYGNCEIRKEDNPTLHIWAMAQKRARKEDYITFENFNRLNQIDFNWFRDSKEWDKYFALISDYHKRIGHLPKPQQARRRGKYRRGKYSGAVGEYRLLGGWLLQQKISRNEGTLGQIEIRLLTELGIDWGHNITAWDAMFEKLLAFKEQYGHCKVTKSNSVNLKFARWVDKQLTMQKWGKLQPERFRRLDEIGFPWRD